MEPGPTLSPDVIPAGGGMLRRLTWHAGPDYTVG
jgi:hypothetical protein